ncbi:PAS sensor protein [Echinicola strongylocentroti]|uniref:histidine kinase n=1 Tax=Echinicola strongylocentroti TaxID=1795355 RepID=A0A2Z4IQX2_9BACT|nr:PAS domain S-box protein [Echinicola strongylocentroti]AWW32956.1 PAS sensor protein [Echinicola strongylocentroti]
MVNPSQTPRNLDQHVFEQSPFPMWIYDLDTLEFLAVNKEAILHYGFSEEEFLSMTIKEIRPKEDIALLEKAVQQVRKGIKPNNERWFRHRKKDGSIIRVKIKSNRIVYRGSEAEIVSAIDLTASFNQQQRIETQKTYLAAIGEFQEILLKTKDWPNALKKCLGIIGDLLKVDRAYFLPQKGSEPNNGQCIKWTRDNKTNSRLPIGLSRSQIRNSCFYSDYLAKGKKFVATISEITEPEAKSVLETNKVQSLLLYPVFLEEELIGVFGIEDHRQEKKWQEMDLQVIHSLISNLSYAIKDSAAYEKLVESETRFRSLVQNGTDLIGLLDNMGNYKYVAPTSQKILGIPPEHFYTKNAFDFIYPDDIPRVKEQFEQIATKHHVTIDPYRFMNAQGNWVWLHTEITNHLDDPAINGIIANTQVVNEEIEKRISSELVASMTNSIGQPGALYKGMAHALERVTGLPNIDLCEMYLLSKDGQHLNLVSKYHADPKLGQLYRKNNMDSLSKGQGLPGVTWARNAIQVWDDLSLEPNFIRAEEIGLTPLQSAFAIPITYRHEFLAVFVAFSHKRAELLSDQIQLLKEVIKPIGAVIQQKLTEEEYRSFFDLSPGPLCVIGYDGYVKKYNSALGRLLRYDKKELLQKPLLNFVDNSDHGQSRKKMAAFIQGNTSKPLETRLLTKEGKVKTMIWKGKTIPASKVIIAVAKDITAQKSAEEHLKDAYTKLKTAQKIGKLGYWSRDLDSSISEWSDETYKIYGYTRKNFIPNMENLIQTFHPEDRHLIKNDPDQKRKPGKVNRYEHRIIDAQGKIKWVQQEIRLVADQQGRPFRIEGTIRDITEEKEYEQRLSISNNRFKLAMQVSNEMIWELNHSINNITRGTGFDEQVSYREQEPFSIANSWFQKIHPDDAAEVWSSYEAALDDESVNSWKMEYRMALANGHIGYFVDRCLILRDSMGKPIRSVGSVLNVTASRTHLEQIQRQNDNLREIAWLQSHKIRAPLSRIMGLTALAKETNREDISTEQIIDWIGSSCKELDRVVHEITKRTFDNTDGNNA